MLFKLKTITPEEFKTVAIIVVVAVCGMLGIDIHLASMPHIMHYLHTDKAHIQQSISVFLLGIGLSLLFYGPLSDRYGRKPIVIFGLLLAALSSYATTFSTNIHQFLITRFLQGVGSGVCLGLGRTMVADVLQGQRLAATGSYFSLFITLSPLLAPMLGGYIQHWFGWQANFMVLGMFMAFALGLYAFFCPETNKHKNPHACNPRMIYRNYKNLSLHRIFVAATGISGIAMASNMAYATTSAFILQVQFQISPVVYGWLTAAVGMGGIIGKLINPTAVRKAGSRKTLLSGLLLLISAGLWMLVFIATQSLNATLMLIAVFLTAIGQPLILSVTMSKALSPFHDKRGAAGALYGSFQMLVAFLVSALVGSLAHDGAIVLGISYLLLGTLGLMIFLSVINREKD